MPLKVNGEAAAGLGAATSDAGESTRALVAGRSRPRSSGSRCATAPGTTRRWAPVEDRGTWPRRLQAMQGSTEVHREDAAGGGLDGARRGDPSQRRRA